MFLLKRRGQWYIQYDANRQRRISTRSTSKVEAQRFLVQFERKLSDGTPTVESILLKGFADKYVGYLRETHSQKYARDAEAAFRTLIEFVGDLPLQQLSQRNLEEIRIAAKPGVHLIESRCQLRLGSRENGIDVYTCPLFSWCEVKLGSCTLYWPQFQMSSC